MHFCCWSLSLTLSTLNWSLHSLTPLLSSSLSYSLSRVLTSSSASVYPALWTPGMPFTVYRHWARNSVSHCSTNSAPYVSIVIMNGLQLPATRWRSLNVPALNLTFCFSPCFCGTSERNDRESLRDKVGQLLLCGRPADHAQQGFVQGEIMRNYGGTSCSMIQLIHGYYHVVTLPKFWFAVYTGRRCSVEEKLRG